MISMKSPGLSLLFILAISLSFFSSCRTYKNVPYFRDVSDSSKPLRVPTIAYENPVIHPDDLLTISILTLDADANMLFAKGNVITGSAVNTSIITGGNGYLVNKEGFVDLPVIGKVYLAGLSTSVARDTVKGRIEKFYVNPSVDVRFANFKITVMGEVLRPASYIMPNEKVTVLDALGMAGDMTVFGRRENVMLVRDSANQKLLVRLNLNSKDIISSPYFYLKQNDLIYVEPSELKVASLDAVRTRNITLLASGLSILLVLATRIKF